MTLVESIQSLVAQVTKIGGETTRLLDRIEWLEAEVSRLDRLYSSIDQTPPSAPAGITAQALTTTSILVSWTAVTDPSGVASYTLERSTDGTTFGPLATTSSTSYTDTVGRGSTAYYRVKATDGVGNVSTYSPTASATTPANQDPVWAASVSITTNAGTGVTRNLISSGAVSDPDGDPLTFSRTGGANDTGPAGITVSSTGVVTVPSSLAAGTYQIEVYADDTTVQAASLPGLGLTGGGTGKAWTFGHAFKQGDVPTGFYITATGPTSFQAEVRNRWADGSVKYAVLSGIGGTVATLAGTQVAPATGEVALTDPQASVTFTGGVTGTYSCPTTNTVGTWSKSTATLVRKIAGPVMTERHYYVPTTDAHVAVWFYVRSYIGGATEVETVVENGWLNVASPTEKDYTVTVAVGGTTRYTGTLAHLHHTRWSRVDWIGTDPGITPSHDHAYLRASKLVPNYTTAYGLPSATTLNALAVPTTPFAQGSWPAGMGDAGGGGRLLNNWEALYCISGDYRAFNSSDAHSRSAGRYPIHYRDENTGNPPLYASHTTKVYGTGSRGIPDVSNDGTALPSNGGGAPPDYYKSHALPFGYLEYLLTGRHSFREQVEFQANVCFFASPSSSTFEGSRVVYATSGSTPELRGAAWSIRSIAAAIVCVPDADARAAQYRTHLGKTLGYYGANYTNQNNLGVIQNYESYVGGTTTYKNFMEDSFSMACGWAYQVANEQLGTDRTRADAFVLWRMKHIVGRMGDQSGYCWRDAATYAVKYANADYSGSSASAFNAGVYADWATVYANTFGANTCGASNSMNGSSGDDPSVLSTANYPYWGLVHTALAFAVDLGVSGASTGWSRLTGASNYAPSNFNNLPLWGVVPR